MILAYRTLLSFVSPFKLALIGGFVLFQCVAVQTSAMEAEQTQQGQAKADSAPAWLKRMSEAVNGQSYQGVFVYQRGESIETLKLVHQADDLGGRQRVTSLSGMHREIIRHGEEVTCYLADRGYIRKAKTPFLKPLPGILTRDPLSLASRFDFNLVDSGRVIDRAAQIVELVPRQPYYFGYRLWIDEQTGLVLRSDLLDSQGDVRERVAYTSLDLQTPIAEEDLQPSERVLSMLKSGQLAENVGGKDDLDEPLPDFALGYQLAAHTLRQIGPDKVEVEHLVLTDGLTTVSVFIDPNPSREDMLEGITDAGRGYAYGAYVAGRHVTVIGEVPQAAVTRIAEQFVADLEQAK